MTDREIIRIQERAADAYRIARGYLSHGVMHCATQRNAAEKSADARRAYDTNYEAK